LSTDSKRLSQRIAYWSERCPQCRKLGGEERGKAIGVVADMVWRPTSWEFGLISLGVEASVCRNGDLYRRRRTGYLEANIVPRKGSPCPRHGEWEKEK
jgi:hypothetical protein